MILCLGRQKMKVVLNGTLCCPLPVYAATDTTINLLSKDGYILLDSEGIILYTLDSNTITENLNSLTTSDGFALMDSQGQLLSVNKFTNSIASNNILMSSDDYMLLDFDNKKLII